MDVSDGTERPRRAAMSGSTARAGWRTPVGSLVVPVLVSVGLLLPATFAGAQTGGTIGGVVRDTSGAVLPGVTVEASSPALIEKVRLATSDGEGQYKIVDLRPGTYSVAFAL